MEDLPPPSARKYWTRKSIAEWLVEHLAEDVPTLVGMDHGFYFPLRYFETHGPLPDWPRFLDDFERHWPTDEEERAGGAKSVFHFDVRGSVAKSRQGGYCFEHGTLFAAVLEELGYQPVRHGRQKIC